MEVIALDAALAMVQLEVASLTAIAQFLRNVFRWHRCSMSMIPSSRADDEPGFCADTRVSARMIDPRTLTPDPFC